MGSTAGLDDVKKRKFLTLPGLELRARHHPIRSQSLYRLTYPGFQKDKQVALCLFCVNCMNIGFLEYIGIRNVNFWFRYSHKIDEGRD
jgi:hypothetical protein